MEKYKYIGGVHKVSFTIESYDSFQYPANEFIPLKFPLYSIGYDKLGKRKQVKTRSLKQLKKICSDLKVDMTFINEMIKVQQGKLQ